MLRSTDLGAGCERESRKGQEEMKMFSTLIRLAVTWYIH